MTAPVRQVRGPRLVDKVLEATLRELETRGYSELSIEEVAARAEVAKTTIYRRWESKAALVRDALVRVSDTVARDVDTGSLRGDLFATLTSFRAFATSPRGQSLLRTGLGASVDAELLAVAQEVRKQREDLPLRIVARAVARGELPKGTNAELVVDTLVGALVHWILFAHREPTDRALRAIIELVLVGAANGGAPGRHGAGGRPADDR